MFIEGVNCSKFPYELFHDLKLIADSALRNPGATASPAARISQGQRAAEFCRPRLSIDETRLSIVLSCPGAWPVARLTRNCELD